MNLKGDKTIPLLIILSLLAWWRLFFLDGIWWDDWSWVWQYFISDSYKDFIYPFQSLGHTLDGSQAYIFTSLFKYFKGDTTRIWNIIKFILFTTNGLLLYRIFKKTLRDNTILPQLIASFYIVSPIVNNLCMIQESRTIFLTTFLLSILLTVSALDRAKSSSPVSYILSLVLSVYSMIGFEGFFFFEIFRPILIKYKSRPLGRTLLYWLPYLIAGIVNMLYSTFRKKFGPYANAYKTEGLFSLSNLMTTLYRYLYSLYLLFIGIYRHNSILLIEKADIFIVLSLIAAVIIMWRFIRPFQSDASFSRELLGVTIIGFIFIIAGIFPYALVRDNLGNGLLSRHSFLANVGVAIFIPSCLSLLYNSRKIGRHLFFSIVSLYIILGVGICNAVVKAYDADWQEQRAFWGQFTARVPDLKPHTVLVIDMPRREMFFGARRQYYILASALNILYSHGRTQKDNLFANDLVACQDMVTNWYKKDSKDVIEFESDKGIEHIHTGNILTASFYDGYLGINNELAFRDKERRVNDIQSDAWRLNLQPFISHASDTRIIYDKPKTVFPYRWIISPDLKDESGNLTLRRLKDAIFGETAYMDWGYIFQKAMVLTYRKDFSGIARLYEESKRLEKYPTIPEILIPFIRALYITGDLESAGVLLFNWALYSRGSADMAESLRQSVVMETADPIVVETLERDIRSVFGKNIRADR